MALLRKGCCCCQLRTCVMVQAWLALIGSVLMIAAGLFMFALMAGLIPADQLPQIFYSKTNVAHANRKAAAAAAQALKIEQGLQGAILFLNGALELPIAIALVYGCRKENRRMIVPYLIWSAFGILAQIVFAVVAIIVSQAKIAAIVAVVTIPCLGLSVYFWLHVLSYYLELREEDKELKRESL